MTFSEFLRVSVKDYIDAIAVTENKQNTPKPLQLTGALEYLGRASQKT